MVVNELRGEKIDIVPFSDDPADFVMKALSPAKVKEVRIDEDTGTAEVIVPDYQLSLAIGKEGQNARLAARLTGWRVDIKSETQLAEEEAYDDQDWAEGEWVIDAETGEQVWQPAEGGEAMSAEACAQASAEQEAEGEAMRRGRRPTSRCAVEAVEEAVAEAASIAEADRRRPSSSRSSSRADDAVPKPSAVRRGDVAADGRSEAAADDGRYGGRRLRRTGAGSGVAPCRQPFVARPRGVARPDCEHASPATESRRSTDTTR